MAPGIPFEDLPPIDLVLLSHDHYDHLDRETVRRIASAHPDARWLVPMGRVTFIEQLGAREIAELDWWAELALEGLVVTCVPAQHFSGRGTKRNGSLWCGWVVASATRKLYFVGDTGRHSSFTEIGAYDPRWFMAPVHINPEEAVESFLELTAGSDRDCSMTAMHWGTFKLTDEPMTEPPIRTKVAWEQAGLDPRHLWIMRHGETRWLDSERQ